MRRIKLLIALVLFPALLWAQEPASLGALEATGRALDFRKQSRGRRGAELWCDIPVSSTTLTQASTATARAAELAVNHVNGEIS